MAKGYSSTRTRTTITCTVNGDPTTGIVTMSLTADQTGVWKKADMFTI